jgi:Cft2 family RNA processing exonuclease
MICTPGTREIAHVMLTDSFKFQQRNEDSEPLFDEVDLERTCSTWKQNRLVMTLSRCPGLKVRFINAGHIVGAACIYLQYGDRSLLYTGDYNTASSRTTEGLKLADLPSTDVLITESTYGADAHPARKTQEAALLSAIAKLFKQEETCYFLLLPSDALKKFC